MNRKNTHNYVQNKMTFCKTRRGRVCFLNFYFLLFCTVLWCGLNLLNWKYNNNNNNNKTWCLDHYSTPHLDTVKVRPACYVQLSDTSTHTIPTLWYFESTNYCSVLLTQMDRTFLQSKGPAKNRFLVAWGGPGRWCRYPPTRPSGWSIVSPRQKISGTKCH
jgi:hypothetical protein